MITLARLPVPNCRAPDPHEGMAFQKTLAPVAGEHINRRMTFHGEATMRTLSTFATLIVGVAIVPIRIAVVESRWLAGQSAPDPADPTESLLVSSWHVTQRQPVAR